VLSLLKENSEQAREEIGSKIGKTVRTLQRSLDKLKETKKIARIGNKNYGY
jgi:DNA-binding Lrp family transcriptional regulator